MLVTPKLDLHALHELVDHGSGDRIKTGGRFVVEHVFRTERDRARDADALAHAAGEFYRQSLSGRGQVDQLERFLNARGDFIGREMTALHEPHRDVLVDGQRVKQRRKLEDVADLRAKRVELPAAEFRNFEAVDKNGAAVGFEQADDVFDRDALARARVADDDHRFTLVDVEGEAAEDAFVTERFMDIFERDHK